MLFLNHSFRCNFLNIMPRLETAGDIRQPSNPGSGDDDGLEFIRCVGGRQPKIHEAWTFREDWNTHEVHYFARADVGSFVRECFATNYLTENGRRVPMFRRKWINWSFEWMVFLTFWGQIDPLGLPISWSLIQIGGAEVPVPVRILVVDLGDTLKVFISIGISLLAKFQFTTGRSLKTRAALGAAPVKISSNRTVRKSCKAVPHVKTPYAIVWWTRGITPWMIAGISLFANNLCGEFLLVL